MWCGCQVRLVAALGDDRYREFRDDQQHEDATSARFAGTHSSATQPIWHTTSPAAYRSAVTAAAPVSARAARSHWAVSASAHHRCSR